MRGLGWERDAPALTGRRKTEIESGLLVALPTQISLDELGRSFVPLPGREIFLGQALALWGSGGLGAMSISFAAFVSFHSCSFAGLDRGGQAEKACSSHPAKHPNHLSAC